MVQLLGQESAWKMQVCTCDSLHRFLWMVNSRSKLVQSVCVALLHMKVDMYCCTLQLINFYVFFILWYINFTIFNVGEFERIEFAFIKFLSVWHACIQNLFTLLHQVCVKKYCNSIFLCYGKWSLRSLDFLHITAEKITSRSRTSLVQVAGQCPRWSAHWRQWRYNRSGYSRVKTNMFALFIVMEEKEKQLKEGDLKLLVGCLVLCYHRELSDIFTKKKNNKKKSSFYLS